MRIAIAADSGQKVGLGHLSRCMALAQASKERTGLKPTFINFDPESLRWIQERGFPTISALRGSWDIIIADSYRFTADQLRALRAATPTLVLIDDLGKVPAACDWVLNSSMGAHKISYSKAQASGFLLGPKFHPLRREFTRARTLRATAKKVKKVLVSLGGGDGWGLLEKATASVRQTLPDVDIHVVVGPLVPVSDRLKRGHLFIHRSPKDMRELMEACDLAVSGGGQTLYELAFTGLPTIAILLADNQRYNVEGFESAGFVKSAGSPRNGRFSMTLRKHLRSLAEDHSLRKRTAGIGQSLIDGKGGARVVGALF